MIRRGSGLRPMKRLLFVQRRRRRLWPAGLALLAALGLGSAWWATASDREHAPAAAARPAHHTAEGFRNRDGSTIDKSQWEVWRWQLSRQDPPRPQPPLPVVAPDLQAPEPNITWIGHSTVLARLGGLAVLTDPQFSERASPVSWAGPKRVGALPLTPAQLPHIDVVLVSHNHYDHLDLPSLKALAAQPGGAPLFVVPEGVQALLASEGIGPVQPLAWWQSQTVGGAELSAVPAQHWSARGLFDRHQTHWCGFVLRKGGHSVFYSGDTGYSADFKAIAQRFGPPDLALLPVGAYEPRDFMRAQHINPAEAVQIHRELGARHSLGVHWGTFALADDTPEQNQAELAAALAEQQVSPSTFRLLTHGATWALQAPKP